MPTPEKKDRSGAEVDLSTNTFAQMALGGLPERPPPRPAPAPKPVDDPPPAAEAGEGEAHEGEIVDDDTPGTDDGGEFSEPESNEPDDDLEDLFDTIVQPSNRTGTLKGGGYQHVRNSKKRTVKLSFSIKWETMELLRRAQFHLPPHITRNVIVDKILEEGLGELIERARLRRRFGAQVQTIPRKKAGVK